LCNILHADDPPHRLALGIAIGVFVTFTPTGGIQMLLVWLLAFALGANRVVGMPICWITNPATIVPMYFPSYVLGRELLGYPNVGRDWWQALAKPPTGWANAVRFYWERTLEIAAPLWLGCLIVSALLALISYYYSYRFITAYRARYVRQALSSIGRKRPREAAAHA
jgi:uncharacterized protein (DUF2062 family)